MIEELKRLRVHLTAWYVGVFALVLLVFGTALFWVLTRQISARLDESLVDAAEELQHAAEIRIREGPPGPNRVDALDELRIPDRRLYLFDAHGVLLHPDSAAQWIHHLADSTLSTGEALGEHDLSEDVTWRAYAKRFRLSDGADYVGVTTADVVEIDHEYRGLVFAFGLAAVLALVLVGVGGWLLARRSTEPVRDAFMRMRSFMADAAHELRTPVAVVEGHAEVALRQPRAPEEYVEILRSIHGESARLGGILENLLTIARADAGAWPVHLESFYLDDVLLDVIENARALGSGKDVALDVTQLEEAPVRADQELLRQLLMILLDNAMKFTPPGGRVDVAVRREDGYVSASVSDTGPGIDPELLPHVFDRFYRGDASHGRSPGAGLGLSIAKWITDVHDAQIFIDSKPGRGTTVVVTFPVGDEA